MESVRTYRQAEKPGNVDRALKIFGETVMLTMIVEMVVLSAVVVGLLHAALHPKPTDGE
ncbi:MAG: hypothetical protein KF693_10080 [Nitrospira sp.]|nr:hypothetical protein [Nitrospira sp.]